MTVQTKKQARKKIEGTGVNKNGSLPCYACAKVSEIDGRFSGVRGNLKKIEHCKKTLDEYLRHSENFKNYRRHKS